jgi:hypothetical protein
MRSVDKSNWRFEVGGPAIFTVRAFKYWLDQLPDSLQVGERVTTEASWPAWREQARRGELEHLRVDLTHTSTKVRCPAQGMAYVFASRLSLQGGEDVMTLDPTELDGSVITLLLEADEWRVHSSGDVVEPIDLGLTAYSW